MPDKPMSEQRSGGIRECCKGMPWEDMANECLDEIARLRQVETNYLGIIVRKAATALNLERQVDDLQRQLAEVRKALREAADRNHWHHSSGRLKDCQEAPCLSFLKALGLIAEIESLQTAFHVSCQATAMAVREKDAAEAQLSALHSKQAKVLEAAVRIVENSSLPDAYSEPCLVSIANEIRQLAERPVAGEEEDE